MTDGQADELPPGTPDRRALGAMESAVRRARESAGAGTPPLAPARQRPADPAPEPEAGRRPDRWLVAAVVVVAVLVVLGAVALALSLDHSPQVAAPPSSSVAHPSGAIAGGRGGTGTTQSPHATSTSRPTSTSATTTVPSNPGAPPVISSLTPSSGTAGQGIQVTGTNFLSSDGQIVATFNGQVAPTSCPAQNTCTIVVPPSSGPQSAQVTITTAGGTSNAVTFTYG